MWITLLFLSVKHMWSLKLSQNLSHFKNIFPSLHIIENNPFYMSNSRYFQNEDWTLVNNIRKWSPRLQYQTTPTGKNREVLKRRRSDSSRAVKKWRSHQTTNVRMVSLSHIKQDPKKSFLTFIWQVVEMNFSSGYLMTSWCDFYGNFQVNRASSEVRMNGGCMYLAFIYWNL